MISKSGCQKPELPPCFCLTQQISNLGLRTQAEKTFEPELLLSCTSKVSWIDGKMGIALPLEYFESLSTYSVI